MITNFVPTHIVDQTELSRESPHNRADRPNRSSWVEGWGLGDGVLHPVVVVRSEVVNQCVRWASEPVGKLECSGIDGLGGPSYKLFPNDSQPPSFTNAIH